MKQVTLCAMSWAVLSSHVSALQVTIVNDTPLPLYVRCISPGNVPVENEYRQEIPPHSRHSRGDFTPGLRVFAAWTKDGKRCAVDSATIKDRMEKIVHYDDKSGDISFAAPCGLSAESPNKNLP